MDDPGPGWELLLAALDPDRDAAARAYEGLRERLVQRFVWRGADDAMALADQTFDRVAEKLASGEEVLDVVGFALGVARFVELEAARRGRTKRAALNAERRTPAADPAEDIEEERRLAALRGCLARLSEGDRRVMLDYHQGRGQERIDRRRGLAEALAVGLNALRIRVHRLRARLQRCVEKNLERKGGNVSVASATRDERGSHE